MEALLSIVAVVCLAGVAATGLFNGLFLVGMPLLMSMGMVLDLRRGATASAEDFNGRQRRQTARPTG